MQKIVKLNLGKGICKCRLVAKICGFQAPQRSLLLRFAQQGPSQKPIVVTPDTFVISFTSLGSLKINNSRLVRGVL